MIKNEYAVSNRRTYLLHELRDNVVTKASLFDILIHRHERGDDDATSYVLRLSKHYKHRGEILKNDDDLSIITFK